MYKVRVAYTHSGPFHSDDVFASAFLMRMFPGVKIRRVSELPINMPKYSIAYDIGGGMFDHHQKGGNGERKNGIPYSSFGLLWKKFGIPFLRSKLDENKIDVTSVWFEIDKQLVSGIDAIDNGYFEKKNAEVMTICSTISLFRPNWDEENKTYDEQFEKAVEFAGTIFDNSVSKAISEAKAISIMEEKISKTNDGVLVMDHYVAWQKCLARSQNENAKKIYFVVYPSLRGGYNIASVYRTDGMKESKILFPQNWWGENNEKLEKKSGIRGAKFVHQKGFIAGAINKEAAIKMAKKAIERNNK